MNPSTVTGSLTDIQSRISRPLGRLCRALAIALAGCTALPLPAAPAEEPQAPTIWQAGKDVIWLPLPDAQVEILLDIAKVTPADFVIDLGSGDGRTVIAAARRGARARGVEFDRGLVAYSIRQAEKAGVTGRASFVEGDLFEADLSQASVITLFLLEKLNVKLQPTLLALKPGTRVVSTTFLMGAWEPDAHEQRTTACTMWCDFYLWIVPARAQGLWRAPQGPLKIEQRFQKISGTLGDGPFAVPLEGRLAGDRIRFRAGGADYAGRLSDGAIEGTVTTDTALRPWRATR